MNLMERFADPQLMVGLSIPEKLAGAGVTALMGMGVTFLVLLLLWGCIALMGRMMNRNDAARTGEKPGKEPEAEAEPDSNSEGELISVIAAALEASEHVHRTAAKTISVMRVKRSGSNGWIQAGRLESMR